MLLDVDVEVLVKGECVEKGRGGVDREVFGCQEEGDGGGWGWGGGG